MDTIHLVIVFTVGILVIAAIVKFIRDTIKRIDKLTGNDVGRGDVLLAKWMRRKK